jgi:NAD(P)-dependent dehydrogenase (short-subunit alcohol dehydrogenase family)
MNSGVPEILEGERAAAPIAATGSSVTPHLQLAGRHVVLTRALSFLGRAQAIALAEAGARVTLLDLTTLTPDGQELERDLEGSRFVGVHFDVMADARRVTAQIIAKDAADVLVNNVAPSIKRPFGQFSADDFECQVNSNCTAALLMSRAFGEGMKGRGRGSIINVCMATHNGEWNDYASYAASNGALIGLTRSLARELGAYGIRANAISPGAVASRADTRIFGERLAEYDEWVIRNQCLKRRIRAEDVANLVTFLASDHSAMITGQNLVIDGGW